MTPRAKRPWRELEDAERAHAERVRTWTGLAPRPVECLWAGRLPIGYLALLLREALGALLADRM